MLFRIIKLLLPSRVPYDIFRKKQKKVFINSRDHQDQQIIDPRRYPAAKRHRLFPPRAVHSGKQARLIDRDQQRKYDKRCVKDRSDDKPRRYIDPVDPKLLSNPDQQSQQQCYDDL